MPDVTQQRFFSNDGVVVAVIEQRSGRFTTVTNTHVLSDPMDVNSDPVHGWVEVDDRAYRTFVRLNNDKVITDRRAAQAEQDQALKAAYEEALELGFSERSARTMSGYVGT